MHYEVDRIATESVLHLKRSNEVPHLSHAWVGNITNDLPIHMRVAITCAVQLRGNTFDCWACECAHSLEKSQTIYWDEKICTWSFTGCSRCSYKKKMRAEISETFLISWDKQNMQKRLGSFILQSWKAWCCKTNLYNWTGYPQVLNFLVFMSQTVTRSVSSITIC